MQDKIKKIQQELIEKLNLAEAHETLEDLRVEYLGRKGKLTEVFKAVKEVVEEERPAFGKLVNEVKQEAEKVFNEVQEKLGDQSTNSTEKSKKYDPTLPGTNQNIGTLHPVTQVKNELNDAFKSLGFEIYEGPEITSEKYAFDNLNFPHDHPARESMDTYWADVTQTFRSAKDNKLCLRPHLTGASVRYMQTHQPPFRFVYPGRVFRAEATDAKHERAFYQWEALIVNKDITFSGGRILINTILERVFGHPIKTRMRAGFFPFVEPGFEIDMECQICKGKGCKTCGHSGWIEMMPGGVPHPNVLKAGGIDPEVWQGFYINIGLDRLALMRYGIDDIRLLHSGDLRFLKQF
jgi:phenylalanyl-tRNA synthetase alpha chain